MWIAEFFDELGDALSTEIGEAPKPILKHLRGPICSVGRKIECDISLMKDKTVSRHHCDIYVDPNAHDISTCIYILDMGSKFRTFLEDDKPLPPHERVKIHSGDILRFGLTSRVKFLRKSLLFSGTRLEAPDKERLTTLSRNIGATYSESGRDCTHLFANRLTATVKILTAVVNHRPLVTVDWLSAFADPSKVPGAAVIIPSTNDFSPQQTESMFIKQPEASRGNLLNNSIFFLAHSATDQYSALIKLCGGSPIRLFKQPVNQWRGAIQLELSSVVAESTRFFLLIDDACKIDPDGLKICYEMIPGQFSVGQLAKTILHLDLPQSLSQDHYEGFDFKLENTFAVEASHHLKSQAVESLQMSGRKRTRGDEIAPHIEEPTVKHAKKIRSQIQQEVRSSEQENLKEAPASLKPAESKTVDAPAKSTVIAHTDVYTNVEANQNIVAADNIRYNKKKMKVIIECEEAVMPPVLDLGNTVNPAAAKIKNTPKDKKLLSAPAPLAAKKRTEDALKNKPRIVTAEKVDNLGWLEAGAIKQEIKSTPSHIHSPDEGKPVYEDPVVAETIEIFIPIRQTTYHRNEAGKSSVSAESSSRDVRNFKKNYVRQVGDEERISKTTMIVLLPKESERQIQLRLDDEMEYEHERVRESLFSDRFGIIKKRK